MITAQSVAAACPFLHWVQACAEHNHMQGARYPPEACKSPQWIPSEPCLQVCQHIESRAVVTALHMQEGSAKRCRVAYCAYGLILMFVPRPRHGCLHSSGGGPGS